MDRTLSDATTLGKSGLGSNENEMVLRIPQRSSIIRASPSDCLVSYPGHSLAGVLLLCREAVGVFYSPSQFDKQIRFKDALDIKRNMLAWLPPISKEKFQRCFDQKKTQWNKCVELPKGTIKNKINISSIFVKMNTASVSILFTGRPYASLANMLDCDIIVNQYFLIHLM